MTARRAHVAASALAEAKLLIELQQLYDEVDALYAATSCPATTECCRFGITRREPYVTSLELVLMGRAAAQQGRSIAERPRSARDSRRALPLLRDPRTCPLLTAQGRCSIYEARPFGCRTFFCDRATSERAVKHAAMLEHVRKLKDLAEQHQPGGGQGRPLTRALPLARAR